MLYISVARQNLAIDFQIELSQMRTLAYYNRTRPFKAEITPASCGISTSLPVFVAEPRPGSIARSNSVERGHAFAVSLDCCGLFRVGGECGVQLPQDPLASRSGIVRPSHLPP